MKKGIVLLLIVFILNPVILFAKNVKIYTYDVLPPFAFKNDKDVLTGIYIEIVKKAISKMPDYEVTFVVVPWARAKKSVKEGIAFAILPPYFHAHDWLTNNEPKRPYIWPYSLPLFTQHDIVICNKKVVIKENPKYPYDYRGLDFVMWRGDGRAGVEFDKMVEGKKINLTLLKDVKSTIGFLQKGRADCTIASKLPFYWFIKQLKKTGEYQKNDMGIILKEISTISNNEGYLGYTDINDEINFPYKKDFSIKFDIEVYKLKKSGEIQKIVDKFIN